MNLKSTNLMAQLQGSLEDMEWEWENTQEDKDNDNKEKNKSLTKFLSFIMSCGLLFLTLHEVLSKIVYDILVGCPDNFSN